jgi:flagellum-specific peptidoglycan hydrolase FlgJ
MEGRDTNRRRPPFKQSASSVLFPNGPIARISDTAVTPPLDLDPEQVFPFFLKTTIMNTRIFWLLILNLSVAAPCSLTAQSYTDEEARAYIQRYKDLAVAQMRSEKIPASVILAQGILETEGGRSPKCRTANNHFGLEADKDWKGMRFKYDPVTGAHCRWYRSAEESFKDNTDFLKQPRYAFLFTVPMSDQAYWCRALKVIKYSTQTDYAERLMDVIQRYSLDTLVSKGKSVEQSAFLEDDVMEMGLDQLAEKIDIEAYVAQFERMAKLELKEYGIPASVTMAQAILESASGKSVLTLKANNHFGIKCSDWTGETLMHLDDCFDAQGQKIPCCFRKYPSAEASFRDHSKFLRRKRYRNLFDLAPTNYEAWCYGLQVAGYATNPAYARRLIRLIQEYRLTELDR